MFANIDKNYELVEGAYKKIKSLYFYSKDKLFERLKISKFESDITLMQATFKRLAEFLINPETDVNLLYINNLIRKIDYRIFPKQFKERQGKEETISTAINAKDLSNVNFLIDMPIELMLLDCIWTLLIGQIANDNFIISKSNFANLLETEKLYFNGTDIYDSIDFYSNRLFKPYFKQYSNWRNCAINRIESEYENGNDTILISLDLKSYFYSVDFNFANLILLLNNDERILSFQFLTNIIEKIYLEYTEKLKSIRMGISADTKLRNVIFPFQLCSSCLLANLYLSSFDNKIEELQNVLFYGRYVDDIILVLDNQNKLNNQKTILTEVLVKTNILEEQENDTYGIQDTNVKINEAKIKTFTFYSKDPKTLISYIKERMFVNASSVDFFTAEIESENFLNKVYYQDSSTAYSKFKDFSILHSDNYNATKYIFKLISLNKNVCEPYMEQNDSIFDFYNGTACLEFRSAWLLVLNLGVIQHNNDFIKKFYDLVHAEIDKLKSRELQDIYSNKKNNVIKLVKRTLIDEFDIAISTALALCSNEVIKREKIIENTRFIKIANMFNHNLVSYPLINYTTVASNDNFSLIETDLGKLTKDEIILDKVKIKYSPRFIHFEEINLFYFIKYFKQGGNIYQDKFNEIFEWFENINHITTQLKVVNSFDETSKIETIKYNLTEKNDSFDIGIASIPLTEEDCFKSIENQDYFLTVKNKIRVFNLLRQAEENNAKIVVLPECYLPIAWLSEVAGFAKKSKITIVSGLQYLTYKKQVFNFIANIQPFYSDATIKYRNAFIHIREKYDYAPLERDKLLELGYSVNDYHTDVITIYNVGDNFKYCNRVCYEFTNIANRAKLRNKVELIIAPEFNKDTNYFSNIIESTARDNLCFIAQANTSIYGDSRLIGPYRTEEKNILVVKGGKNDIMIVDNVEIFPLIRFKEEIKKGVPYDVAIKLSKAKYKFKKPSARFFED